MGIFLPFTIYLQSVLGFLRTPGWPDHGPRPRCLSMFRGAGGRGGSPTRSAAKYILMLGLILFGGGMGWVPRWRPPPTSTWYDFLPAAESWPGIGMGCVFAPMVTRGPCGTSIPRMAGAASRRAEHHPAGRPGHRQPRPSARLLQNRLVSSMNSQARDAA